MIRIDFIAADGTPDRSVEGRPGDRLLDVAQSAAQPLEGTCEGQMACSTCHVILAPDDFAKLPPASEMEDDLLDLAPHVGRHSRLACQIVLDDAWGSLTVRMPGETRDMGAR